MCQETTIVQGYYASFSILIQYYRMATWQFYTVENLVEVEIKGVHVWILLPDSIHLHNIDGMYLLQFQYYLFLFDYSMRRRSKV